MVLNSKYVKMCLICFYFRLVGLKTEAPSAASTSTSTPQPVNNVVHHLASALLQIEQGIERRFLKAPLGKLSGLKLHVSSFVSDFFSLRFFCETKCFRERGWGKEKTANLLLGTIV